MSDPVISTFPYLYYTADRDPTSSEPLVYNGHPTLIFIWFNTATVDLFWCMDNTTDAMKWSKMVSPQNALSVLTALGWNINSNRSIHTVSSPAFNSPRTPSAISDTFTTASVQMVNTLLTTSTITVQVDTGSGYNTVATIGMSGLAATNTQAVSFIVPANSAYKILQSGSGTNTLISITETSF